MREIQEVINEREWIKSLLSKEKEYGFFYGYCKEKLKELNNWLEQRLIFE